MNGGFHELNPRGEIKVNREHRK